MLRSVCETRPRDSASAGAGAAAAVTRVGAAGRRLGFWLVLDGG